ncbi:MAG: hypothetical protein E7284_07020 [Lachnospiraceae bacterium]|nr:hypothetical protein [Lachnospiraceae bacterium]
MMKKVGLVIQILLILFLCGCNEKEIVTEDDSVLSSEQIITVDSNDTSENRDLIDDFLNGDIPAYYDDDRPLWFKDMLFDEAEWDSYSLGVRADFDNDGEDEQSLNGPYGGMCLDIQGDCVRIMAHGQGTAIVLDYVLVDDIYWIVYKDTTHSGRQHYHFIRYNGGESIEEEHILEWHEDENGERRHYYDDEVITEERYEEIRMQYFEEK